VKRVAAADEVVAPADVELSCLSMFGVDVERRGEGYRPNRAAP